MFNVVIIIQFFFMYGCEALRCQLEENCNEGNTPLGKVSAFVMIGYMFAHWLYVSQYIKTSLILPSLYRIGFLLLKC